MTINTTPMTIPINALFPDDKSQIHSLCIGSGRFLRSVLVPALIAAGATTTTTTSNSNSNASANNINNGNMFNPVILQTRGRTFMDYCHRRRSENRATAAEAEEKSPVSVSDFLSYEVDTVQHDGQTSTDIIPCCGAGSFGTADSKACIMDDLLPHIRILRLIGVGVTEAGLANCHTKAMTDLYDVLNKLRELQADGGGGSDKGQDGSGLPSASASGWICDNPNGKICVVNTDNVPLNGAKLKEFMLQLAAENDDKNGNGNDNGNMTMIQFLTNKVAFHNTMVDRITSQRPGSNGLVPRAEPTPLKALVIEDLEGDLPLSLIMQKDQGMGVGMGVVVRKKAGQLDADIALKLRVANGTHTAIAHVMALCGLLMTDALSSSKGEGDGEGDNDNDNDNDSDKTSAKLMYYLDSLFQHQILKAAEKLDDTSPNDVQAVYDDWRRRLIHAHFGLSTFFITQNGAAKGGIRIGPTILDLVKHGEDVNCSTIFALAAILRFLTPAVPVLASGSENGSGSGKDSIYRGWLDKTTRTHTSNGAENEDSDSNNGETVEYADGLSYNMKQGWYEFRCACNVSVPNTSQEKEDLRSQPLPVLLGAFPTTMQSSAYEDIVRAYLIKSDGGDLSCLATDDTDPSTKEKLDLIVRAVSTLYARMVAGDGMLELLKELPLSSSCEKLLD